MDCTISLIAAVASNGVIGNGNEIPWYHPEDLEHFRETTIGHTLLLGRKTFQSVNGPLDQRDHIVLSQSWTESQHENVTVARDKTEAANIIAQKGVERIFVCGGGTVYEQYMDAADELIITHVPGAPAGDVHFPTIGEEWSVTERDERDEFVIARYER